MAHRPASNQWQSYGATGRPTSSGTAHRSSRTQRPLYAEWDQQKALAWHGEELTQWQLQGVTGPTTHLTDYREPTLPPKRDRRPNTQMPENMFRATTNHMDDYGWKEKPPIEDEPLPEPPGAPAAWPLVSFHGRCDPETKALHDAVIDHEEERAWRTRAKVVPERVHAFHGEDEAKAVGKEPFSRAGRGYPTRARHVQSAGGPTFTRHGTGSTYAWPRTEQQQKPRKDAAAAGQQRAEARADKPHLNAVRAAARTRADDYHSSEAVANGLTLENPTAGHRPTGAKRASVAQPGLMSAAAWKRHLNERARTAMPGAMRDAARSGRPTERPESARPWIRNGRNGLTGAGTEPLKLGDSKDPRVPKAPGVNKWHSIAAGRYK